MRVGNLMPGDRAVVTLTLAGPLEYADGEATFRFPLVVAPRYIPGVPLPGRSVGPGTAPDTDLAPDASRITPPVLLPGFPNPVRLSLVADHRPGRPVDRPDRLEPARRRNGRRRPQAAASSACSRASGSTATSSCASRWRKRRSNRRWC